MPRLLTGSICSLHQHLMRYYGAYANHRRRKLQAAWSAAAEGERRAAEAQPAPQNAHPHEQPNAPASAGPTEQTLPTPPEAPIPLPPCRSSWARPVRGSRAAVDRPPRGRHGRVAVGHQGPAWGLGASEQGGRFPGAGPTPEYSPSGSTESPACPSHWRGGRSHAWSGVQDPAILAAVTEDKRPGPDSGARALE